MRSESEERQLQAFLLGALPEAESGRIERRLFTDTDFFESLCALEEDLVRRFLRGDLSPSDRALFEGRLRCSADLSRKTELARSMMSALDAAEATHQAGLAQRLRRGTAALLFWSRRLAFAAAGVALLAVPWSLSVNSGLRKRVIDLEAKAHEQQAVAQVAFLLHPGAIRGRETSVRLRIPATAESVLLRLETRSGNSRCGAVLRSVGDSAELWSSVVVPFFSPGGPVMLEARMPGVVLPHGDYVLQLNALAPSGRAEPIEYYTFSVDRE